MHIFEKFTNAIAQKQQQSLASFNLGRGTKGFQSMVEDIQEEIEDNFKESIEKHAKNIEEYLFGDQSSIQKVKERFNLNRLELMIEDQHEKFMQNLQEDILKITEQTLPIDTGYTIERPIRIQRQVIGPPSQIKAVELSPQIPTKDMSALPPPEESEKVQSKNHQPPIGKALLLEEDSSDYDQPLIPPNYHQPLLNEEYRNKPMKTNSIADISWDFNVSHNIEEQVIGKLSEAIQEKHKQVMQNTEEAIQNLMERKSFPQFWEDLLQRFKSHVEEQMDQHSKNIEEYYTFDQKRQNWNFAQMFRNIADTVEQKHEYALTQFQQKMKGVEGYTLGIDLYREIERPQRIQMAVIEPPVPTDIPFTQESKQMAMGPQDAKESSPSQLQNVVHAIEEYVQEEYMFLSEDPPSLTIQHPGTQHPGTQHPGTQHPGTQHPGTQHPGTQHPGTQHPGRTISDRPIAETANPITKPNLATSEVIIKRDIVKELEERRRRIQEKELKSKKMRTKLVKLEPIASKEERLIKEKEAREKIDAQVNFVKGIGESRKTASFKIREWKQQSNKNYQYDISKTENTPSKYSKMKIQNFKLNQSAHYDLSESNVMRGSSKKESEKEKSFILRKPMPYNLYNVNFKEHEQFRLGHK